MNPPTRRLILASASPRRAELLRGLGVEFEAMPSRVEEDEGGRLAPSEVALTNAARKALKLAESHPDALILGADTVVALGAKLFGKPVDLKVAAEMLGALSGKTHAVFTGVCLLCRSAGDLELFAERTVVAFRPLTPEAIADYLAKVPVLDKAGAYAIQASGDKLIREISGSFTNVVGLPMERVKEALEARGWGGLREP